MLFFIISKAHRYLMMYIPTTTTIRITITTTVIAEIIATGGGFVGGRTPKKV